MFSCRLGLLIYSAVCSFAQCSHGHWLYLQPVFSTPPIAFLLMPLSLPIASACPYPQVSALPHGEGKGGQGTWFE